MEVVVICNIFVVDLMIYFFYFVVFLFIIWFIRWFMFFIFIIILLLGIMLDKFFGVLVVIMLFGFRVINLFK